MSIKAYTIYNRLLIVAQAPQPFQMLILGSSVVLVAKSVAKTFSDALDVH
jgi:hypothetical protein